MPWWCPAGDATVRCPEAMQVSPAGTATGAAPCTGSPSELCRSQRDSVACPLETQPSKTSSLPRRVLQEKPEDLLSWRSCDYPAAHIQIATDSLSQWSARCHWLSSLRLFDQKDGIGFAGCAQV